MKKILIFSDTHGDINRCLDIIEKADSVSAIFHAGDYTGDAEDLESIYPNIPIYYVKGNNDYFSKTPSHMLVTIDGVKIFITHGHEQNVKYEYEFMTLRKAAEKYDPDLIIGTHSYAGVCISILADRAAFDCPSVGIVTDFTVHPFWESTFLDYYVIPDELLEHEMQKKGIAKKKLLPFGIPIREQFVKKNDPIEARKKLGIENIPTILIMMGSMGYGNIKKILAQIDTYPKDFQVLCVCGTNKKIKSVVDECDWNKKIYSYGFVDNVDVMMDAADFIITKPGGLTTSESLAKGLPMITMNPLPGQEDRNLNFLVNNGAAIMVNDTYPISEAINQMFACPWRVAMMEESVRHLGKPNATADLYNFCCAKVLAKSTLI